MMINGTAGNWFRTINGLKQEYLLSPILFNIFQEKIMAYALTDHEEIVSTGASGHG